MSGKNPKFILHFGICVVKYVNFFLSNIQSLETSQYTKSSDFLPSCNVLSH